MGDLESIQKDDLEMLKLLAFQIRFTDLTEEHRKISKEEKQKNL